MQSLALIRLSVSASAIAIAGAFAVPAAAAQPTGTQDTQPSTQLTPSTTNQTTPAETVSRTGLPSANQNQNPPASEQSIVVTGSRIKRPEIESPVPVAVLGQQALLQDAAANVSDTINELPQVALGATRTNTNFLTSGNGTSTINLRGLGFGRTLVLVNGRRFIGGFAGVPTVDINNIPTDFIDRIEVVTGGSSAVYGSDAVAGVVNFILKDRFDGVQLRAQGGQTFRGDDPTYFASLTAGQSLFGDRLHLIGNFSWDRDDGLPSRNRSFSAQDCGAVVATDPFTGRQEVCGPPFYSTVPPQGRFQLVGATGSAQNVFNGQSLFTFDTNNQLVSGFNTSVNGFNRDAVRLISVPLQRELATGIANWDIAPDVHYFAELTYAHVKAHNEEEPAPIESLFGGGVPAGFNDIHIDNPFIPAPVAAAIAAANSDADPTNDVSLIAWRRRSNDIFSRNNFVQRHTFRIATGFKGTLFGKYNWEVSYVYGRMHDNNQSTDVNTLHYNQAIDAIRVGPGNVLGVDIVCRDPAARAAGCIPMDIFGANTVDPRAAAYVVAATPRIDDIVNKQNVVTGSISGPLFTEWAGDVTAALGAEYRKESTTETHDPLTIAGQNSGNQLPDLHGQFHVWEAFGEVNVPLLKDVSFTKYLGVNGAVRYSKYSTVGSNWSWNVGAEWEPIKDLRFRGQYATAVRAPNISELFRQPGQTFPVVRDPCNGTTATSTGGFAAICRAVPAIAATIASTGSFTYTQIQLQSIFGFNIGNPNLKQETAKTLTFGTVFTPSFVPGLGITVDYYDVKIKNAINQFGRDFTVNECLLTNDPAFCQFVFRNSAGFITQVDQKLFNISALKTRGIDTSFTYARALHLLPDDRLTFDLKWTHLINNSFQASALSAPIDFAGTFGHGSSRDSAFLRTSYKFGIVTVGWQTDYLSGGPLVRGLDKFQNPVFEKLNQIHDYWLHDVQLRFDPDKRYTLYLNVDNVFDKKPSQAPGAFFGNPPSPTGLEISQDMDPFGRRFVAGVRVKFF
jgi:outer membrane receptor protein involved in Fe transport